jgi:hypothetical protein
MYSQNLQVRDVEVLDALLTLVFLKPFKPAAGHCRPFQIALRVDCSDVALSSIIEDIL